MKKTSTHVLVGREIELSLPKCSFFSFVIYRSLVTCEGIKLWR